MLASSLSGWLCTISNFLDANPFIRPEKNLSCGPHLSSSSSVHPRIHSISFANAINLELSPAFTYLFIIYHDAGTSY